MIINYALRIAISISIQMIWQLFILKWRRRSTMQWYEAYHQLIEPYHDEPLRYYAMILK